MSGFNSKAKMAYFKDNVQSPDEQEDFSVQQYYYSREGGAGPAGGDGLAPFQGYPAGGPAPYGGVQSQMAQPAQGMMRQQSAPNAQPDGYPSMPQQSRSTSHGAVPGVGASPVRGGAGGAVLNSGPAAGRDGFNVIDSSNFPSLNPNAAPSRYGVMGGMGFGGAPAAGGNPYMGADGSGANLQTNFTIQNEDFPALPGSGPGAPPARQGVGGLQGHNMPSSGGLRGEESGGENDGGAVRGNVTAAIVGSSRTSSAGSQTQRSPSAGTQQAGSRATMGGLGGGATGMQLQQLVNSVEGDESSNPVSRPKDMKYGLLGLLDVIKMTDRVRDLNTLALGTDLTTFGLNLSSTDSLYLTFSSPFSDAPAPPEIPYFSTPSCYLMQPPSLKPDHLNKMHMETLFYMFYSMPRDQLQTAAAVELYRREWWFHADLRLWMKMRAPPADSQAAQTSPHFLFFDVSTWEAKIYSGNSLRMSGFLPEDDIAMAMKSQQQGSGAVPTPVSGTSAAGPNSASLNHGSQPLGPSDSGVQAPSSVNSRPISGGQNAQRS